MCGGGIALRAPVVAFSHKLARPPLQRDSDDAGELRFVIEHVEHNPFQFVLDFLNVNIVDL